MKTGEHNPYPVWGPCHEWGDDWPHWDKLREAQQFIYNYVNRNSLCYVIMKEKYGTLRYDYVIAPGKWRIKVPFIRWDYDIERETKYYCKNGRYPLYILCWRTSWLYRKWALFGYRTLRKAVKLAAQKWPEIALELEDDL